eukprot:gnl/TRDRNA2_/TRDRNA2_80387_c0_seq1.p1 gnl/TRDRNA2_/TRDRNA2_80387_c0~~gnl/TRDRNA2_/TRDRNA2_80387_c0_seq1.p1  ORF type:complete len:388 (+),score=26.51 gnl/TRDRNA2_/TRDRNA2_80387_c0_seq1:274-1437(+)
MFFGNAECRPAVFAAAVVLMHTTSNFRLDMAYDLEQLIRPGPFSYAFIHSPSFLDDEGVDANMDPFPFDPEFLLLYQNFLPAGIQGGSCLAPRAKDIANHLPARVGLVPRSDLRVARCAVSSDDGNLVDKCRAQRFDSYSLAEGRRQLGFPSQQPPHWQCPGNETGGHNKYSNEPFRSCSSGHGSWGKLIGSWLKCVAVVVGEALQLRPSEAVLDWGSGCGWMLTWLHTFYGTTGYGIEELGSFVSWANRFSRGEFCIWGKRNLSWVPDASFDAVVSFWALYHLPTVDQQCSVARQLLLKLKPGGRGWFGGNTPSPSLGIHNQKFRRHEWLRCLRPRFRDATFRVEFYPEVVFFRRDKNLIEFQHEDLPGDYLFWPPAFSTIVTRLT